MHGRSIPLLKHHDNLGKAHHGCQQVGRGGRADSGRVQRLQDSRRGGETNETAQPQAERCACLHSVVA